MSDDGDVLKQSNAEISEVVKTYIAGLGYAPNLLWTNYFDESPPCTLFNFERFVFHFTSAREESIPKIHPVFTHQPSCSGDDSEAKVYESKVALKDDAALFSNYVVVGLFLKAVDNMDNDHGVAVNVGFRFGGKLRSACTTTANDTKCTAFVKKRDGIQYQHEGMMCSFVVPKYNIFNKPTSTEELMSEYLIENRHKMKIAPNSNVIDPITSSMEFQQAKYDYIMGKAAYSLTVGDVTKTIFASTIENLITDYDVLCQEISRIPSFEKFLSMTADHPVRIASGVRALTQDEIEILKRVRYVFDSGHDVVDIVTAYHAQREETDFPDDVEPVETSEAKNEFYASVWIVKRALYARAASLEREKFNFNLHALENVVVGVSGPSLNTTVEIGVLYAPRRYCHQDEPKEGIDIHHVPKGWFAHGLSLDLPL